MQAHMFVCLSKQARDKFQPLHPLQKFCSEEGQDGKFGKQVRRGLCGRGCPSVLVRGELRWEPRISILLGTAGERRRGAVRKGQAENCSPIQAASSVPADSTGGRRKSGSPAFPLSEINGGSPCIHFFGAQKSLAFAWE